MRSLAPTDLRDRGRWLLITSRERGWAEIAALVIFTGLPRLAGRPVVGVNRSCARRVSLIGRILVYGGFPVHYV